MVAVGLAFAAKVLEYDIDPAMVGLSISYAISISGSLNWAIITGTATESEMSRVERILHYCATPSEAPLNTSPHSEFAKVVADPHWPHSGRIEFQNVVMSYKPTLPPVRPLSPRVHSLPCVYGK